MKTLGEKLEPILEELEMVLWEHQATVPHIPEGFTEKGFRGSCKIFMSAMMDFTHKKNLEDKLTEKQCCDRAEALGHRIRHLVFEFTGKDSTKFY